MAHIRIDHADLSATNTFQTPEGSSEITDTGGSTGTFILSGTTLPTPGTTVTTTFNLTQIVRSDNGDAVQIVRFTPGGADVNVQPGGSAFHNTMYSTTALSGGNGVNTTNDGSGNTNIILRRAVSDTTGPLQSEGQELWAQTGTGTDAGSFTLIGVIDETTNGNGNVARIRITAEGAGHEDRINGIDEFSDIYLAPADGAEFDGSTTTGGSAGSPISETYQHGIEGQTIPGDVIINDSSISTGMLSINLHPNNSIK